jgi:N5-(carboxyethyl)ornithine synthase
MNTIGFVISNKENERRRAILPKHLAQIRNKELVFVEEGYGKPMHISDAEFRDAGVNVVNTKDAYAVDIVCNPKNPLPDEYQYFRSGQTLFGWIHAVQGHTIVDLMIDNAMTAIAWEDMFYLNSCHVFWRNNEIAGEAAVFHALPYIGLVPEELKVAVIGRGNTARGAIRAFDRLGADVTVYDRKRGAHLRNELGRYDVIVNAVLWDVFRNDHIIYREDLAKMKPGALLIDVSCDEGMGIETSRPTSIEKPTYVVDGIVHYVVDHTPAIFFASATESLSEALYPFLDDLIEGKENPILKKATIIENGRIIDQRITQFQNR